MTLFAAAAAVLLVYFAVRLLLGPRPLSTIGTH